MINKVPLLEIDNLFPNGISLYIGMASFEERCFSILGSLKQPPAHCLLFKNVAAGLLAEKNLNHMVGMTVDRNTVVSLDLDSPITAADAFTKSLTENITATFLGAVFIDTTTFTHEQLLILLRVLDQSCIRSEIYMGYTGAEKYSTNTEIENVWLSRGVSQIRTVLGYPGNFAPSKKLHLTILVGFEHERATAVIEQFEPVRLTLMCGDPSKSVSADHYDTNKRFFEELKRFVERTKTTQTSVETLYFSCIDPIDVRDKVLQLAMQNDDFNMVVCPMNTKLSTIGVGLAALENQRIQVAYARAIEYNEDGYSTPSDTATIFKYVVVH